VLIGNARWTMQAAIGGTFVALNFSYWCMALLSRKLCWNYRSIFTVKKRDEECCKKGSYTERLFAAICSSKEYEWLRKSKAAPESDGWDEWLKEAYENKERPGWNAIEAMKRLVTDKLPSKTT